jgi:glycerol-3-phosphate O-acyltransferase/dihydroxyacetone phosphate acyltransferase
MLARSFNSIPVERPQDVAKAAPGAITTDKEKVFGQQGTKFTALPKDAVLYAAGNTIGTVVKVISDTELLLKREAETPLATPTSFKAAPKIDHSDLYKEVYTLLKSGGCVGIFPEGGRGVEVHIHRLSCFIPPPPRRQPRQCLAAAL